jgi:GMP synthase-like glutamine amidotransferase
MKHVLIFRHITCEGPGYFAEVLEHYNISFKLIRIDQDETPPSRIDDASALVFMGGPMSVNDNLPWINQELELIRQAVDVDLPVLGHCLGGQLIAKALGGTISANPVKEIGWLPVQKIHSELSDDWLQDISDKTTLFHWHGETFSIPDGATAILKSQHCAHQGFVIGNTLALQCHVEMTVPMVSEWATLYEDELANPSETIQNREEMISGLDEKVANLQETANAIYRRWLKPLLMEKM